MNAPSDHTSNRLFISCVSDEFEKPEAPFPGFRGQLRHFLTRADCEVKVQGSPEFNHPILGWNDHRDVDWRSHRCFYRLSNEFWWRTRSSITAAYATGRFMPSTRGLDDRFAQAAQPLLALRAPIVWGEGATLACALGLKQASPSQVEVDLF